MQFEISVILTKLSDSIMILALETLIKFTTFTQMKAICLLTIWLLILEMAH